MSSSDEAGDKDRGRPAPPTACAGESLRESERYLTSVLETTGDGFLALGPAGNVIDVNGAYCRMLGYTREEMLRLSIPDLDATETSDETSARIERLLSGAKETFPAKHRRKDGSLVDVEVSAACVQGDGRGMTIGFLRDVTARLAVEAQLRQAQRMESVGRLAGGMAHDFNNMLNVILGHAELALAASAPGTRIAAHLEEIRRAAGHSADLTRRLLAFARRQVVSPRPVDLNEVVPGMLAMLGRLIGEEVSIAFAPGADLRAVRMDPVQVDQILANLCVNARDAIDGTGRIEIETANVPAGEDATSGAEGDRVRLTVRDDGCGMDAGVMAHLFEPFFTTKEPGKGTGLGLATVYGIVTQNGGTVDVRSEPGKGTEFRILLPALPRGEAAQPARDAPPATAGAPRGSEAVLLVEDEPQVLELTRFMLELLGYRVIAVGNPAEAAGIASDPEREIDLLLTDVVMPELDGRELAAALRQARAGLPVLFMSGYAAETFAGRDFDAGFHFLQKPFSVEELAAKMREALGA